MSTTSKTDSEPALARSHRRLGWIELSIALAFGLTLDGLLGFKSQSLMLDTIRREMWSLAHFHAALFGLVNLVYVAWAETPSLSASRRLNASRALRAGTILLPAGFFLGGIAHPEGDPSLPVLLVPIGAVLIIYTAIVHTFSRS